MVHNYKLCSLHDTKPDITQPVVELAESRTTDSELSGLIPRLDSYLLASSLPMFEISIIENSKIHTFCSVMR